MAKRWKVCTVTTIDGSGKPHSVQLYASSAFDAAQWYTMLAEEHSFREAIPLPTPDTIFSVQMEGHATSERVEGRALQAWIAKQQTDC